MSPRHALLKPAVRAPEPPRPRQEAQASPGYGHPAERTRELRSETRDESECFEHLLAAPEAPGQGAVADFSGDGGRQSTPHRQEQGHAGAGPLPDSQATALWQTLLNRLEAHLEAQPDGPLEVQLELPNLGPVAVHVLSRGNALDIALHFSREAAWQYCAAQRQASTAWLTRQLGRPVRLSLHREVH